MSKKIRYRIVKEWPGYIIQQKSAWYKPWTSAMTTPYVDNASEQIKTTTMCDAVKIIFALQNNERVCVVNKVYYAIKGCNNLQQLSNLYESAI